MAKPWIWIESAVLYSCRIFDLRKERYRSPRTGREHDFFLLQSGDWVNVIPLTSDEKVVMVRQYRFGTKAFSLEIPGGMVDAGDTPDGAATRELLEETGYGGEAPVLLGVVHPNPAIHTNRCYTYLIEDVHYQRAPRQDATEDIEVQMVPLAEIPGLIRDGEITHSLVIAAFYWYFSKRGFPGPSLQRGGSR